MLVSLFITFAGIVWWFLQQTDLLHPLLDRFVRFLLSLVDATKETCNLASLTLNSAESRALDEM